MVSATAVDERVVTFESDGIPLHGVLHEAAGQPAVGALVFVHAFAEEKKCAHRPFVEAARAVAQSGRHALRFDLRGCGDSEGDFAEATTAQWRADVECALAWAAAELRGCPLGLLGLQLGAAWAAQIAETRSDLSCLVLWEPVVEGHRYVSLNLRRSELRKKLTAHEGGEVARATPVAAGEAPVPGDAPGGTDFDGYLVTDRLRDEIAAVDLTGPKAYAGPTLILNLTGRDRLSRQMQQFAATYPHATALAVRQEPIWATVGLVDPTPTVEATVSWLQSPAGQTEGHPSPRPG